MLAKKLVKTVEVVEGYVLELNEQEMHDLHELIGIYTCDGFHSMYEVLHKAIGDRKMPNRLEYTGTGLAHKGLIRAKK